MTRDEIDRIFEANSNGEFIRLIIPPLYGFPEMNMIGKKKTELTKEEVVLVKKYAGYLYASAQTQ